MSQPADREGVFRGSILNYALKEWGSGAVSIAVEVSLDEFWDGDNQAWIPWSEYDMTAYGDLWVVKKNGTLSEHNVQSIREATGWNGSFAALIEANQWQPQECQFDLRRNEFEGSVSYRVSFVNPWDATPSTGGIASNIDASKAKNFDQRFGSQIRAIGGNATRNGSKPSGKPPVPSREVAAGLNTEQSKLPDDLPF